MKRDPELVRMILQLVEECPSACGLDEIPGVAGRDRDEVAYHVELLRDAGYISAEDAHSMGHMDFVTIKLTWKGHEFLDATRDDTVWRKTKERALKPGVSFTMDLLAEIAKQYATKALGLS